MPLLPKPERLVDEDFLELVRNEPCAGCGAPPRSDPDHLQTRGARGSDHTCAPLCRLCHGQRHALGIAEWERGKHVNLWRINSLLLQRYFTDPAVILRKTAEFLEGHDELTSEHAVHLRRILDAVAKRAA